MRKSNGLWKKALISVICIAETFIMAGSMAACAVKNDGAPSQQGAAESNESQQNTGQSGQSGNEQISLDDAKNAALADAGVSASDVTYTKEKLDYEDGIAVYDIEFLADGVEYEYTVNAVDGTVVERDVD